MQIRPVTILLLLLCLSSSPAVGRDIIFSPLPMEQKTKVLRQIMPLLHYLEKPAASQFKVTYFDNYEDILENFKQGKIDLVLLGPLPYIHLRTTYPQAEPMVRFLDQNGKDTYTCSLITGIESGLTSIAQLKGKKIGLTQPHSTCGYLTVHSLLEQAGINIQDTRFHYAGSHQKVALGVIRGKYDAGGVKTSIAKKYSHLGLTTLSESPCLPGFVLVANKKTMTDASIERIRTTLLDLHPLTDAEHRELTMGWGKNIRFGTTEAMDSDYDIIRQQSRSITIPAKGNL